MRQRGRRHVLATILYTDIVGSSRLAAELGDRRWRVVLARHHLIVRKELKRHGGREIDNAGDGFLATFDDQEAAIRCACSIVESVRVLGVEVRAGLHVGQAELLGRKLGGIVVNAGARVMGEAGPGQVVVSGVLKDLLPGSGFEFRDLGERALKGIDGRWALFAVARVDGKPLAPPLDATEAASRLGSIRPPPVVQRRWGRVAIAALALAIGATTMAVIGSREPPIRIVPISLLRIDPHSGQIMADVPLDGLGSPPARVPPNEIWITNKQTGAISVVDVSSGGRTRTVAGIDLGPEPVGLTYSNGSVWLRGPGDSVLEVSPSRFLTRLVRTIPLRAYLRPAGLVRATPGSERLTLMAADSRRVWIVAPGFLRLFGIDPETGDVVFDERIGTGSTGLRQVELATGAGYVWVSVDNGTVFRVDPESHDIVPIRIEIEKTAGATTFTTPGNPSAMAIGFGIVWIGDPANGLVHRIDAATAKVIGQPIRIGEGSASFVSGVAVAGGRVWAACPGSKTVVMIDPVSATVERRIPVPFRPADVISAYGQVWVSLESRSAFG